VLLLLTIGIAFLVHVFRRELRPDLLVYAAGVWLVLVHHRRGPRDTGGALPD